MVNQAECKEKKSTSRGRVLRDKLVSRRKRTGERGRLRRVFGEAGKKENERCPAKRQGRRELLKKDSNQQNVSFPLYFQGEYNHCL